MMKKDRPVQHERPAGRVNKFIEDTEEKDQTGKNDVEPEKDF